MALISICMKIILLINAKYGNITYDLKENDECVLIDNKPQIIKASIELKDNENDEECNEENQEESNANINTALNSN